MTAGVDAVTGRISIFCGAGLGGLAVVLGAFGAHGLEGFLVENQQAANYETAVRYQMYHALALVLVGIVAERRPTTSLRLAGWCFVGGVVLFCGALYGVALARISQLGMVAPVGGALLIAGWSALAVSALRRAE
jgi:uncharacterized membrane protein YgdD (TMEM256/DUF423 family)